VPVHEKFQSPFVSGHGPSSAHIPKEARKEHLALRDELRLADWHWYRTSVQTLALLETLTSIGTFVLFMLRRKETEYLWFSIYMCFGAIYGWFLILSDSRAIPQMPAELLAFLFQIVGALALIAFYDRLLQHNRNWLFKSAVVCTFLEIPFIFQSHLLRGLLSDTANLLIERLLQLPGTVWVLVVLFATAMPVSQSRTRRIDARMLLIPAFLGTLLTLFTQVASATYFLGLQRAIDGDFVFIEDPFQITIREVIDTLSLLGVFAILVLRFARTISEQERYATEVEGARHVQQFLIPEDLPHIPGLTIESDYRPAREVGGDFFQVIPDPTDGSALILVGDVAGKGMQAGMLATLLVGAMRTAATFSSDPTIILNTLNNRLCGKGNATCVALRIESDGAAILVNAGHLPPYLNGRELPMEGALPLGTIPNVDFPVLRFHISAGDTLTLISDGILEAQKPDGELFGFERITQHLAINSTASSLATAAQEFGQEDDITVLTIARVGFAV